VAGATGDAAAARVVQNNCATTVAPYYNTLVATDIAAAIP